MLGVATALATAAIAAGIGEVPRVMVPALVVEGGADEAVGRVADELLMRELTLAGGYRVVGVSDVLAILDHEVKQQLLGCNEMECLAEITGALGARYTTSGNIGRVGDGYVLNLKLLDAERAEVMGRHSERVADDDEALVFAMHKSVQIVLGLKTEADFAPFPALYATALAAGGASVVAAAIGLGLGAEAQGSLDRSPLTSGYGASIARARDFSTAANVSFVIAGAAAATALVSAAVEWLWLSVDDEPDDEPADDLVPVRASPSPSAK